MSEPATIPGSCWADNPAVIKIARHIKAMVTALPEFIDEKHAETRVMERDGYIIVSVSCAFKIPK